MSGYRDFGGDTTVSKYQVTATLYIGEKRSDGTFGYGTLSGSTTFETNELDFAQLGHLMEAFHKLQAEWKSIAEVEPNAAG
jgi:hypothetical protein